MIKNIYTQILNRMGSNSWLLIELLLVFCLIWYIVDSFFMLGFSYSLKNHRDLTHTWEVQIAELPEQHPEFDPAETDPESAYHNFLRIMEHLKNYPKIDEVGIAFNGSTPGKGSYSGTRFSRDSFSVNTQILTIEPTFDFFNVFRYTAYDKPVHMTDFNWDIPNGLVINRLIEQVLFPNGESAVGQTIYRESHEFKILGVVDNTKRFQSGRPQCFSYVPNRLDENSWRRAEILIRHKEPLPDQIFKNDFANELAPLLRAGNFYFVKLDSVPELARNTERRYGLDNYIFIRLAMLAFFLINIILCLLGTFLYRTNLRKEEIGVRMALGSSRKGIVKLFIAESICLLSLILIPAILLEFQFVKMGFIDSYHTDDVIPYFLDNRMIHFAITNLIALLLMLVICVLAVYLPAKKISLLPAADTLHYE